MSLPETQSSPVDYVPYFEELIIIQEKAITSFKRWGYGFVLIGLVNIVLALILNTRMQGVASQIFGLGGLFFGVVAAFPYREIVPRRSRIITYALLKQGFEKFPNLSDEDRKRLRDLADETIKRQI